MKYSDLKGKVALITGAGSGIGRKISIELGKQGCNVMLLDLDEKGLQETKTEISDFDCECRNFVCNVTDEENIKKVFDSVFDEFKRIDIVVNNAGIALKESYSVSDVSNELWDKIMNINLKGYFLIAKYAEQKFIELAKDGRYEEGSMIFICSNAGILGSSQNIYGISNSGRIGLMKQVALEMGRYGVRSNAIIPGDVLDTEIWDDGYLKQRAEAKGMTVEEVKKYYETRAPLKKKAMASDVANMVLFLASVEASRNTTGQILKCDGGQVMV